MANSKAPPGGPAGVSYHSSTVKPTRPTFLSPVPFYGTILISIAGIVLLLCCFGFCCAFCCCKKRGGGNKRSKVVGSTSPSALTRSEKVQPDVEELLGAESNEDESYLGKISFSVDYNLASTELSVTVVQAQELPAMDIGGTSDPYVKVMLLPNSKPVFETKVQSKTLNPLFNETFVFQVPYNVLTSCTLAFYVYDYDRFSKNEQIGTVVYPLKDYDVNKPHLEWRDLQKPGSKQLELGGGEICFSLRYVPTIGQLTIVILEAKNIPRLDSGDLPDSYVKISLRRCNTKRGIQRKKSSVKKATVNPYFNEAFVFDVPYEYIKEVVLRVSINVPGWLGPSKRLGLVVLGSHIEAGTPFRHWSDMLTNQRRAIASWHELEEYVKHQY